MKNQKTDQSYESFVLRLISNEELDFKYKSSLCLFRYKCNI